MRRFSNDSDVIFDTQTYKDTLRSTYLSFQGPSHNFGLPNYNQVRTDFNYATRLQSDLFYRDTSAVKTRLDTAAQIRINSDNAFAWSIHDSQQFIQNGKNIPSNSQGLVEAVNRSILTEAVNQPVRNRILRDQQVNTPSNDVAIEVSNQPKLFWAPIIIGAIVGTAVGVGATLALQGAATAGGAAIADQYHAIHSHLHNEYQASQIQTLPGQKYVGHYNYVSALAALDDAKAQAQPWLNWGEQAALNHFQTSNQYDKLEFNDHSGFAISTQK